ncbi:MAG: hypothetical protein JW795_16565 [Chitinivibrionales bacterium]|nr:hypothetical protein [Chitinivibrionales bacterium]
MKTATQLILTISLILLSCTFPYDPQQQGSSDGGSKPDDTNIGKVYPINNSMQTCNPSISPDETKYPGCMLWLNFSGTLKVKVPSGMSDYDTVGVKQHDRITITDTSSTVRWFIKRASLGVPGHLQDPEWSTHPDYMVTLGSQDSEGEGDYDAFAVRISDKASLKMIKSILGPTSTPHIWVADTAIHGSTVANPQFDTAGFVKKEDVVTFFGTDRVKLVYAKKKGGGILSLYYIDYSSSTVTIEEILKPEGKENAECESPLISPEGNWVTYNCFTDQMTCSAYMQRLRSGEKPVLVASGAFEPHWWVDNRDPLRPYYIIYAELPAGVVVGADLTRPEFLTSGAAGTTLRQRLIGSPLDVPSFMALRPDNTVKPELILRLPFKGGLSPNGWFLSTAYSSAFMFKFR